MIDHCPGYGEFHLTVRDPSPEADMNELIATGCKSAEVTKDGRVIYSESECEDETEFWAVSDAEAEARKDPDHDYRITINAPLHSETYQRQDENKWVLIDSGKGFA